jgi:hypothetical protein
MPLAKKNLEEQKSLAKRNDYSAKAQPVGSKKQHEVIACSHQILIGRYLSKHSGCFFTID